MVRPRGRLAEGSPAVSFTARHRGLLQSQIAGYFAAFEIENEQSAPVVAQNEIGQSEPCRDVFCAVEPKLRPEGSFAPIYEAALDAVFEFERQEQPLCLDDRREGDGFFGIVADALETGCRVYQRHAELHAIGHDVDLTPDDVQREDRSTGTDRPCEIYAFLGRLRRRGQVFALAQKETG
jgi:hypothetical protein